MKEQDLFMFKKIAIIFLNSLGLVLDDNLKIRDKHKRIVGSVLINGSDSALIDALMPFGYLRAEYLKSDAKIWFNLETKAKKINGEFKVLIDSFQIFCGLKAEIYSSILNDGAIPKPKNHYTIEIPLKTEAEYLTYTHDNFLENKSVEERVNLNNAYNLPLIYYEEKRANELSKKAILNTQHYVGQLPAIEALVISNTKRITVLKKQQFSRSSASFIKEVSSLFSSLCPEVYQEYQALKSELQIDKETNLLNNMIYLCMGEYGLDNLASFWGFYPEAMTFQDASSSLVQLYQNKRVLERK